MIDKMEKEEEGRAQILLFLILFISVFGVVWRRVCLRSPCMRLSFSSTEFQAALVGTNCRESLYPATPDN